MCARVCVHVCVCSLLPVCACVCTCVHVCECVYPPPPHTHTQDSSCAVFGLGAVGLAVIFGCKLAGAQGRSGLGVEGGTREGDLVAVFGDDFLVLIVPWKGLLLV